MAAAGAAIGGHTVPEWEQYISRIQAREERALGEFYDSTGRLVYSLAMRILGNAEDAEEVVGDVFSQVWRNAAHFDAGRGSVLAWLMMMTRSRALDRVRSRGNRPSLEQTMEASRNLATTEESIEEAAFIAERRRLVREALAELSEDQRSLIELAFYQGLSHSELSACAGLPVGTVKTRIRLGMLKLRDRLAPLRGAL
jgi:RNA polymerase sigma-70 factor (ECF subfamily)